MVVSTFYLIFSESIFYLAPDGHDFWVLAQVLGAEAGAVDDHVEIFANVGERRHSLAPEFAARTRNSAKKAKRPAECRKTSNRVGLFFSFIESLAKGHAIYSCRRPLNGFCTFIGVAVGALARAPPLIS